MTGNMPPDLALAGIFFLTVIGHLLFGAITLADRFVIPSLVSVRRLNAS